jgi:hypothetical protein
LAGFLGPLLVARSAGILLGQPARTEAGIKQAVRSCLERVDELSERLIRGEIPVF